MDPIPKNPQPATSIRVLSVPFINSYERRFFSPVWKFSCVVNFARSQNKPYNKYSVIPLSDFSLVRHFAIISYEGSRKEQPFHQPEYHSQSSIWQGSLPRDRR